MKIVECILLLMLLITGRPPTLQLPRPPSAPVLPVCYFTCVCAAAARARERRMKNEQ